LNRSGAEDAEDAEKTDDWRLGGRGKPRLGRLVAGRLASATAAALRSRTAGSQDESRCSAIHKPPHSILG